jgi:hypothetical protein
MDDYTSGRKPRPARRRWVLWAVFGTVGLIMGAAYATGFATTSNTSSDPNTGAATPLFGQPAAAGANLYANTVAPTTPLAVAFDGNYGTIAAPTVLFTVDLTGNDTLGHALAGTFYTDVLLTNWHALNLDTGTPAWDTLDLKFYVETCDSAFVDWSTATAHQQMHVDSVDAHVTFTGLAAGHKYCIGLDTATSVTEAAALGAASGGAVDGTVMFRPVVTTVPTPPQFTAAVNRSA